MKSYSNKSGLKKLNVKHILYNIINKIVYIF